MKSLILEGCPACAFGELASRSWTPPHQAAPLAAMIMLWLVERQGAPAVRGRLCSEHTRIFDAYKAGAAAIFGAS